MLQPLLERRGGGKGRAFFDAALEALRGAEYARVRCSRISHTDHCFGSRRVGHSPPRPRVASSTIARHCSKRLRTMLDSPQSSVRLPIRLASEKNQILVSQQPSWIFIFGRPAFIGD